MHKHFVACEKKSKQQLGFLFCFVVGDIYG